MKLDSISLIQGFSLGLEFIDAIPEERVVNSIVFDCFILRFVFCLPYVTL